jgi:hypothetical protein
MSERPILTLLTDYSSEVPEEDQLGEKIAGIERVITEHFGGDTEARKEFDLRVKAFRAENGLGIIPWGELKNRLILSNEANWRTQMLNFAAYSEESTSRKKYQGAN